MTRQATMTIFHIDEDPQICTGKWSNILADPLDTVGGTLKSRCRLHHQSQNIVCRSKEPAECLLKYHNDVGL